MTSDHSRPRVLFIDNYDSFTYNLVDYVSARADTEVLLNDADLAEVRAIDPGEITIASGSIARTSDRSASLSNTSVSARALT